MLGCGPMSASPDGSGVGSNNSQGSQQGAAASGIGIGAALVSIANLVGPSSVAGTILLYLVPVATLISGAALRFIKVCTSRFFQLRLTRRVRRTLVLQLDDPEITARQKRILRSKIEELDSLIIAAEFS